MKIVLVGLTAGPTSRRPRGQQSCFALSSLLWMVRVAEVASRHIKLPPTTTPRRENVETAAQVTLRFPPCLEHAQHD